MAYALWMRAIKHLNQEFYSDQDDKAMGFTPEWNE
jgi:hypothetical protein